MKTIVGILLLLAMEAKAGWVLDDGTVVCHSGESPKRLSSQTKGGSVPWPWGQEVTFPWTGIEGVWQTSTNGCSNLFLIKVKNMIGREEKYITIGQYDPSMCRMVAQGVGSEKNRVVRAVLTGEKGSFEMTIHAFKTSSLKDLDVVMRIRSISSNGPRYTYQINRLQKNATMVCQ